MPDPQVVDAPRELYRVARRNAVLTYSRITPGDAQLTGGNRFDVPGGGVLYAGSDIQCCYAETLARFRPSPAIRKAVRDEKDSYMVVGGVPSDWRLQRVVAALGLSDPLPFLDVEDPETHAFLSEELAGDLVALGYGDQDLDFSDVCNRDRRLSRRIAEYAFTAAEVTGEPSYSGIRYMSRINPAWECWAIFEDTHVFERSRSTIELSDGDFRAITKMWGLRPF